jgi:acetyl-CoA carboxylase biotin carboxyl carrier protein
MFTIDEIREIIKMIDQSSIQRFECEQETTKLVIVKNDAGRAGQTPAAAAAVAEEKPVSAAADRAVPAVKTGEESDVKTIVSPVVGTFYAAPEPGAEPFVKVGRQVAADTVVCIVEVMKLFNEVEAGMNGEIIEVLVQDGEFVEYGQPLFLVRSGK